eukprot:6291055-Karenia_brevis.AAC.1
MTLTDVQNSLRRVGSWPEALLDRAKTWDMFGDCLAKNMKPTMAVLYNAAQKNKQPLRQKMKEAGGLLCIWGTMYP